MSLRELTADKHHEAEKQEFVKELLGGNITKERYATFLYNMHPIYNVLEAFADINGLTQDLPDIHRASAILEDYRELWDKEESPKMCPSVEAYMTYIKDELSKDPKRLFAHLYVRHMGDLAGGQIIAKRVPGSGKFYQFKNPDELKVAIRSKLDDSMADEANNAFDWAIKLMKEMNE